MSEHYTLRICRECGYQFTLGPRQLSTADLKIHCGVLMEAHTLERLEKLVECGVAASIQESQQCDKLAHWSINGRPECDECITSCVERMPDNRSFLAPAMEEIK